MEVKVAATCLKWSQPAVPHFSSNSLASAISSPSSKRGNGNDRALICRFVHHFHRFSLFGTTSMRNLRFQSCQKMKSRGNNDFSDEEFSKQIQELAKKFQLSSNYSDNNKSSAGEDSDSRYNEDSSKSEINNSVQSSSPFHHTKIESVEPSWLGIKPEQPDWAGKEEIIPAIIERKAKSVDLPHSLRIIKRKNHQREEGLREAGEPVLCSVKKAFSSMVFIIREIQSYSLQMREILFYEDLQGILSRVQKEMNASFVWLFQQVFSHTPTLMVSVMILLANFTVYSMANNSAIAVPPPPSSLATLTETVTSTENQNHRKSKFDSSSVKIFSVSVGENNGGHGNGGGGGGGKIRFNVSSGADGNGDGRCDESSSSSWNLDRSIVSDEISSTQVSSIGNPGKIEDENKEELKLWNSIVEEASTMQNEIRDEALDEETMKRFVSPVTVESEAEDYSDYFKTAILYQLALTQEPQNPLLLSNYAQFLYLVVHDHDRAEEYFKRAVGVETPDAEALSRYGTFLWVARKKIGAAEEAFLEAIAADPGNTFYSSNYANFLWNTGGEDTCYPLNPPSSTSVTNEA